MRILLNALLFVAVAAASIIPIARLPASAPTAQAAPLAQGGMLEPLPRGCGSVTPPGEELAACCIRGFVYIDGAGVAGAKVTITSPRSDSVVLYTQVYSGTGQQSYYQLSLSAPPLNIKTGETITITAQYGSYERSLTYQVQPGSQQVDVVLRQRSQSDYTPRGRIWGQAETKKFNSPYGVAADSKGNIYVVDRGNARVQVFRGNGDFVRQWGMLGTQPGQLAFPRGIAVDSQGNVFVGDSNNFRIQKFSSEGTWITNWGGAGPNDGQFEDISALAVDSFGAIYVLDGGRIQKFTGTGEHLFTIPIKGGERSQFANTPDGIAVDRQGKLYVSGWDGLQGEGRIHIFAPDGRFLTRWDRLARFMSVVAVDVDDFVYFIDMGPREVVQLDPGGKRVGSWPLQLPTPGYPYPAGMTTDGQGNLYVVLFGPDIVQRYSINSRFKSGEWGGRGRSDGMLVRPQAIAHGDDNSWYVADTGASRVQQFTASGTWVRSWGSPGSGDLQLAGPAGIAVGPDGTVYVADTENQRIRQFSADGQVIAGWGTPGAGPGQFSQPRGITVGPDSALYIADTGNNRIQRRGPDGSWQVWSGGAQPFQSPQDVALAADGTLYVADTGNRVLQRRGPDGGWSLWAPPPAIYAGYLPVGVTVAPDGRVLVADAGATKVHVFQPSGTLISTWGGQGSEEGLFQDLAAVDVTAEGTVAAVDGFDNRATLFNATRYSRPIATINWLNTPSVGPLDTLVMRGTGQDSDESPEVTAYRWSSDRDGVIGTDAVLSRAASTLTPGTHRITLEVQDGEGEWSNPAAIPIFVASTAQVAWTALLYLAGDYPDRGSQLNAFNDALTKLQTSLHNPAVRVAAQIDGPADGDTIRVLIVPGNPPQVARFENIGEQAMDTPASLAAFLRWGQGSFPAAHYYLAVANHGQAIQGIAWDRTSDQRDDGVLNFSAYLTPVELGQALRADGVAPVDVIHLDACSMNLLEVAYELRPQADASPQSRLLIASQYLGWNYFAYDDYINAISASDTPAEVALKVTDGYAQRATRDRVPFTIAALDLGRAGPLATAVDNLAAELTAHVNNDRDRLDTITTIWQASPHFESNGDFVNNELDDYTDLLVWAGKVQQGVDNPAVKQRASKLIAELSGPNPLVVPGSNRVGSGSLPTRYANGAPIELGGSSGISIFYPGSQQSLAFDSYIDNRLFAFTSATRWADFLLAGVQDSGPGPRKPWPGPLTGLDPGQGLQPDPTLRYRVLLPLVRR